MLQCLGIAGHHWQTGGVVIEGISCQIAIWEFGPVVMLLPLKKENHCRYWLISHTRR